MPLLESAEMKPSWLLHTLGAQAGLLPTQCLSPKLNSSQLSSAIHHANPQAELGFGSFLHPWVHV